MKQFAESGNAGKSKFILSEFGVDLKELLTRYNAIRGLPFVLVDCLNYLLDKGIYPTSRHFIDTSRSDYSIFQVRLTTQDSSLHRCEMKK